MKLQTALRQPLADGLKHRLRFPMAPAVDDGIIRIALKPQGGITTSQPQVKRIVQEQIGQQRTYDSLNAKDNFAFERVLRYR